MNQKKRCIPREYAAFFFFKKFYNFLLTYLYIQIYNKIIEGNIKRKEEKEMSKDILVEHTVLFGPDKGKRVQTWFIEEDPEIKRLLEDPRCEGKIVDKR